MPGIDSNIKSGENTVVHSWFGWLYVCVCIVGPAVFGILIECFKCLFSVAYRLIRDFSRICRSIVNRRMNIQWDRRTRKKWRQLGWRSEWAISKTRILWCFARFISSFLSFSLSFSHPLYAAELWQWSSSIHCNYSGNDVDEIEMENAISGNE